TEIKNSFVTSADLGEGEECENLERIAYEKTFLLREPNKKSSGLLRIATNNPITIPLGTIFLRKDGVNYIATEEIVLGKNDINHIYVECEKGGEDSNCPVGFIDRLKNPIEGVEVRNDKPFVNGANKENKEEFRQRVLEIIYKPASSGNKSHYLSWLKDYKVDGLNSLGRARVIPRFDGLPYTIKIIITDSNNQPPSEVLLIKVRDYIEALRPEGALITYEGSKGKLIKVDFKCSLNAGIMENTAIEKAIIALNKYFYSISLIEGDSNVRINNVAGVLVCLGIFKNIQEIKLNGISEDVIISFDEVPVLSEDFGVVVV
ncbi:MAG: baseplate J/gp47 family protein, partial [Cetobacterium sp.]